MANDVALYSARQLEIEVAQLWRPPHRTTVPDCADQHVIIHVPGKSTRPYDSSISPLMVKPAELLTSRHYEAVIMVKPAQDGGTQALVLNWAAYTIINDPADFLIIHLNQAKARGFSQRDVSRLIRHSPLLDQALVRGQGDNVHDKVFRSGMLLSIQYPTPSILSGVSVGRVALTDYDRMPKDIGGEGSAFALASNRTLQFGSAGKVAVESSPSMPVLDAKWRPKTAHEAPPSSGILGLYNTGDRQKPYAPCPHCGEYFSPYADINAVHIPDTGTVEERAAGASMTCTVNGCSIDQTHEADFKRAPVWLREGQTITPDGQIHGTGRVSRRASFWEPGWLARSRSWQGIVRAYLLALEQFNSTGDEEDLQTCVNTMIAGPYLTQSQLQDTRDGSYLESRIEALPRYRVPEGVLGLLASVDVQSRYFDVLVKGFGFRGEQWVVDSFQIRDVDPKACIEDWNQITDRVVNATYRVSEQTELRIHATAVDSGGSEGVTTHAYNWWRGLRPLGLARRVRLVKGGGNGQRVRQSFPDTSGRKDRNSGSHGDVPVLILNSNQLKDAVYADLQRETPGPGYVHFPDWLPGTFFDALTAEQRLPTGWHNPARRRNEPFDLMYYIRALWIFLRGEKVNWQTPYPWLMPIADNCNAISPEGRRALKATPSGTAQPQASRVRFKFGQGR